LIHTSATCSITYLTLFFFFFNDTATTEIYTTRHTLSLHDALPISRSVSSSPGRSSGVGSTTPTSAASRSRRSEEHTSELQSRLVISYAVFCLKKKKRQDIKTRMSTQDSDKS